MIIKNNILTGDIFDKIKEIPANYVDAVVTDPPYFLDKLDEKWSLKKVNNNKNLQTVKSLPAGMKFDKEQGKKFYNFYIKVSKEIFRVLKPGGYFMSFSSPRLYHRMACAMDDAGFEVRDSFIWLYTQNQPKAMSINHFINRQQFSEIEKQKLMKRLEGWKTPQLKSCFEPIALCQKPTDGTFLENTLKWDISLLNTNVKTGQNMFPANVVSTDKIDVNIDKLFLVGKPSKKEKGDFNNHKTVKPLELMEHLISLYAMNKNAIILDPFAGSGTTLLAAHNLGLNYIGIELNKDYVKIIKKRLKKRRKEFIPTDSVSKQQTFMSLK